MLNVNILLKKQAIINHQQNRYSQLSDLELSFFSIDKQKKDGLFFFINKIKAQLDFKRTFCEFVNYSKEMVRI